MARPQQAAAFGVSVEVGGVTDCAGRDYGDGTCRPLWRRTIRTIGPDHPARGLSPVGPRRIHVREASRLFLRKLKAWKEAIIEESRLTMAQLQVDSLREPDLADRASSETDWALELRTRDRQRKLIAKIDCAIRRLVRRRVRLLRSHRRADFARSPRGAADRDHDARGAGAPRAPSSGLAATTEPQSTFIGTA